MVAHVVFNKHASPIRVQHWNLSVVLDKTHEYWRFIHKPFQLRSFFKRRVTYYLQTVICKVLLKSKPALTISICTGVHKGSSSCIKIFHLQVSNVKTCCICLPPFLNHIFIWDMTVMYHLQKTTDVCLALEQNQAGKKT